MTPQVKDFSAPWIIAIATTGTRPSSYDMRVLAFRNGWSLSPLQTTSPTRKWHLGLSVRKRIPVVSSIYEFMLSREKSGISMRSAGAELNAIRKFWHFCEAANLSLEQKNKKGFGLALFEWKEALSKDIRANRLTERSARGYISMVSKLLAAAIDISSEELLGRRHSTRRAKIQSTEHEKVDIKAVDRFLEDLTDICEAFNESRLLAPWPLPINFRDGSVAFYSQGGRKPLLDTPSQDALRHRATHMRSVDITLRRRALTVRVQAEFLRFIGMTGMNLTPVKELNLSDVTFKSISGEYIVSGFKNRSGSNVQFRIPTNYRPQFENWLTFRRTAFNWIKSEKLFPFLDLNGEESSCGAERGFRGVVAIMRKASRPYFHPRNLRYCRAQKALRTVISGADIRKVAQDLQHSLPTLLQSYTRGSLATASLELGTYLATIPERAKAQRIRAGGACAAPKEPLPIVEPNLAATPDCIHPAGCYFCQHFRAIESYDGIHAMLSYKEYLRLRAGKTPSNMRSWESVAPIISRIDAFIDQICSSNPERAKDVNVVKLALNNGDIHPFWRGWTELILSSE